MSANPSRILLAAAATLAGRLLVLAQDWQTVDDFALASGDAEAHGVAVDAAGGVYVVGTASGHGIVRYSADGGSNWITRVDSQTNNFSAITVDRQGGALFVGVADQWIIRRSTDQGVSWETVDDFYQPFIDPNDPGFGAVVCSLSSDGQGHVYGAGREWRHGPNPLNWCVRGSDNGGTNWDTRLLMDSGYGDVRQITCGGEDVYVMGATHPWGSQVTTELILKSSDYGATWTQVFQSTNETYNAIASDSAGNLYAAENGLVRKAASGGTNWTTVDAPSVDYPNSIAIDAAGNVCVTGLTVGNPNQTWFTRQYSVATGQWNTTDLFSYATNSTNVQAIAMGTAITPDGSKFVVGYGTSDSVQRRWVVRKRTIDAPRLQIALAGQSVVVSWTAAYTNCILEWTGSAGASQPWQNCGGTVCVTNGCNTATFALSSGAKLFRLKSTAAH